MQPQWTTLPSNPMEIKLNEHSSAALYKQIVQQVERGVRDGHIVPGEQIDSMNALAGRFGISRETVKKAYGILVEKGVLVPKHGMGFFAADPSGDGRPKVLVLFDRLTVYKQILFNALEDRLGDKAEIAIHTHNQSLDLLEYYLDNNLDLFDYYVVTPHFPLDPESERRTIKLIKRIPNRKLILLDRLLPNFPGRYGAVYQDFENDVYDGLKQGLGRFKGATKLRVITLPQSLYGSHIRRGVERFTRKHNISVEFLEATPERIDRGDVFLLLNSQLDAGLVELARAIKAAGYEVGKDVKIISYNEFDTNELILGGLTTVSTDFIEMGRIAADMILSKKLSKAHCPFRMKRRNTF